jgi:hypothetical protein
MKRFARDGSEVWVGVVPKLGIVVYDPQSQESVPANRVRLYIRDQERLATFAKDIVRERLVESANMDADEQLAEPAEFYLSLRLRYTHCFSCKQSLNSLDFAVCRRCRWIRCACSACGCSLRGRGNPLQT